MPKRERRKRAKLAITKHKAHVIWKNQIFLEEEIAGESHLLKIHSFPQLTFFLKLFEETVCTVGFSWNNTENVKKWGSLFKNFLNQEHKGMTPCWRHQQQPFAFLAFLTNLCFWRSSNIIDQCSKDTCTDLGALGFQKSALSTPLEAFKKRTYNWLHIGRFSFFFKQFDPRHFQSEIWSLFPGSLAPFCHLRVFR